LTRREGALALTIGNTSSFCTTKARATERVGAVNDAALPKGTHASHIEHAWRPAHTCDPSGRRDHSRIVATIGHSVWNGRYLLGGAALLRVSDGPAASHRARRGRLTPASGVGDFSSGTGLMNRLGHFSWRRLSSLWHPLLSRKQPIFPARRALRSKVLDVAGSPRTRIRASVSSVKAWAPETMRSNPGIENRSGEIRRQ
jgi:hypothetical protein